MRIFRSAHCPEVRLTFAIHVSSSGLQRIDDVVHLNTEGTPDEFVVKGLTEKLRREFVGKHPDEWITTDFDLS